MQHPERRTNKHRSDATRTALLDAGRSLFTTRGYADTGTPQLVAAAGVTRGALYHHYADKQALFRAVVEVEAAAVATEVEQAAPQDLPPLEALRQGGKAFLAAMAATDRARLLLVDAPAILGRATMDGIDARHGGRTLREGIEQAVAEGVLQPVPVEATAALLSAAYDRAALAIVEGADPADWIAALENLLNGLSRSR